MVINRSTKVAGSASKLQNDVNSHHVRCWTWSVLKPLSWPVHFISTLSWEIPTVFAMWRVGVVSGLYQHFRQWWAVEGRPDFGSYLILFSLPDFNSVAQLLTVAKEGASSPKVDAMSAWLAIDVSTFRRRHLMTTFIHFLSTGNTWSLCFLKQYAAWSCIWFVCILLAWEV